MMRVTTGLFHVWFAASKVDPMHLKYFKFAGRVIALSMMHKMQVGIVFDRAFFLQLGGIKVCLEDIKDADPCLYSSCKQILDMDPCAVDEDVLVLTFVLEVEELGSMKVFELLPDGKHISVNSRNRKEYIDLIIKHRFVTSIEQQVTEFARGFAEIVTTEEIQKLCFKSLLLGDLDGILHGSESPISVDDWKAHTEYNGYKETDRQISWFWKVCISVFPLFPSFCKALIIKFVCLLDCWENDSRATQDSSFLLDVSEVPTSRGV